jgi:hypothetical protein
MDRSDILFMFRCIFYMQAVNVLMAAIVLFYIQRTRQQITKAVKIMMNLNYGRMGMASNIAGAG